MGVEVVVIHRVEMLGDSILLQMTRITLNVSIVGAHGTLRRLVGISMGIHRSNGNTVSIAWMDKRFPLWKPKLQSKKS